MVNKQTIKNKTHAYNSKEKKAYYIGYGFGLAETSSFACPGVKKIMSSMSIEENISFFHGVAAGDDYLFNNKIKRKQIYR